MNRDLVDKIARAVLYEGYILYPYRPSVKNHQRWTFGGLYPKTWSDAQAGTDPAAMQTQCVIEASDVAAVNVTAVTVTTVTVTLRFLHLIDRTVGVVSPALDKEPAGEPAFRAVASLEVGDKRFVPWQEAGERDLEIGQFKLAELAKEPKQVAIGFAADRTIEYLRGADHKIFGLLSRQQQAISAMVEIAAVKLSADDHQLPHQYRLTIKVTNTTAWQAAGASRDDALLRSLISTHLILNVTDGAFVSSIDPPAGMKEAVAACQNIGNWPVLVGAEGERDTMLASPIILYDYPQLAPESPGDLFDGTEIDEILTLRILTLTDEEKRQASAIDDRARDLMARTESLAREQLMNLHGVMRNVRAIEEPRKVEMPRQAEWNPFEPEAERPRRTSVLTDTGEVRVGSRVRLRPLGRADIFDIALNGKAATVISIEEDFENRIHVAVTVDDDPGNDFGMDGKPGHRFFFGVDEVEALAIEAGDAGGGEAARS